jgi:hypothetical protein
MPELYAGSGGVSLVADQAAGYLNPLSCSMHVLIDG